MTERHETSQLLKLLIGKGEPMSNSILESPVPGFLERDLDSYKKYVKYHRLLAKAEKEGRIDGKYRCPVCGMRFMTFDEADACCKMADNIR